MEVYCVSWPMCPGKQYFTVIGCNVPSYMSPWSSSWIVLSKSLLTLAFFSSPTYSISYWKRSVKILNDYGFLYFFPQFHFYQSHVIDVYISGVVRSSWKIVFFIVMQCPSFSGRTLCLYVLYFLILIQLCQLFCLLFAGYISCITHK